MLPTIAPFGCCVQRDRTGILSAFLGAAFFGATFFGAGLGTVLATTFFFWGNAIVPRMGRDASFGFGAPGPKIERVARALVGAGGEIDLVPDETDLVPVTGAFGFDGLPNSEKDGLGLGAGAGAGAGTTLAFGALNPNMGFFAGAGLGAGADAGALGAVFGALPNSNEKAGALFLGTTG